MSLGSTFLSVLFRFLAIVVSLETGKGNSSDCTLLLWIWVLCHPGLGDFLLFLTFFYFLH